MWMWMMNGNLIITNHICISNLFIEFIVIVISRLHNWRDTKMASHCNISGDRLALPFKRMKIRTIIYCKNNNGYLLYIVHH